MFVSKENPHEYFNKKVGVEMFEASKLHTIALSAELFRQSFKFVQCEEMKKSLENLGFLFLMTQIRENSSNLLEMGLIDQKFISNSDTFLRELLGRIRGDCLVLAEGFIISESVLRSALADQNEKPYENLFHMAKTFGALNKESFASHYVNTIKRSSLETYPKL